MPISLEKGICYSISKASEKFVSETWIINLIVFNFCFKDHQMGHWGRIRRWQGKFKKHHSTRNSWHLQWGFLTLVIKIRIFIYLSTKRKKNEINRTFCIFYFYQSTYKSIITDCIKKKLHTHTYIYIYNSRFVGFDLYRIWKNTWVTSTE